MKYVKLIIAAAFLVIVFGGCNFIGNTFTYKSETEKFMESLLKKDYHQCASQLAFNARNNPDTVKAALTRFRKVIVDNFGDKLNCTFVSSDKTFFTSDIEGGTPLGETRLLMQISNSKNFGVIKVLYDDKSQKIASIKVLNIKDPVPDMLKFWLFGIVVSGVLAFNIYMLVKVARSAIKGKWKRCLAIILLNVPSIGYNAVSGFFFKLLGFQFLLGVSFEAMGYTGSYWVLGVPLGSLFVLYKLKRGLYKTAGNEFPEADYTEPLPAE